jgi:hypothetical protein
MIYYHFPLQHPKWQQLLPLYIVACHIIIIKCGKLENYNTVVASTGITFIPNLENHSVSSKVQMGGIEMSILTVW